MVLFSTTLLFMVVQSLLAKMLANDAGVESEPPGNRTLNLLIKKYKDLSLRVKRSNF
jgi:hypothetical protein